MINSTKFGRVSLRLVPLVIFLLPIVLTGCSSQPKAVFTPDITSGAAPFPIKFVNQSKHADSFEWDFGDGHTMTTNSIKEQATHVYTKAGSHIVTLTAVQQGEPPQKDTVTMTVNVLPGTLAIVTLQPSESTLDIHGSQSFVVGTLDEFGNEIPDATISWNIMPEVGEINADGTFTAGTKAGNFTGAIQATIAKETTQLSVVADISIRPDPLASIQVTPTKTLVKDKEKARFTAAGYDKYLNVIPQLEFEWEATGGQLSRVDGESIDFVGSAPSTRYEVKATATFRNQQATGSATVGIPPVWMPTGKMDVARRGHTATLLADGKVLIVGWISASAEIYDPATGIFTTTGNTLFNHGQGSTATLLEDGRVLIVGGTTSQQSAEIYDPATDTFVQTGSLNAVHSYHTATSLYDGRVLIAGGQDSNFSGGPQTHSVAELYDPVTDTFILTGNLNISRSSHAATLLSNGQVLITGGFTTTTPGSGVGLITAELYDPATGVFHLAGDIYDPGSEHIATLLPNGRVLLVGSNGLAALYNATTAKVSAVGSMITPRRNTTATLLNDGRVLVAGGFNKAAGYTVVFNTTEIYDPDSKTFYTGPDMTIPRWEHTATLLKTGEILVAGGSPSDGRVLNSTAEVYYP